jgi:hypothetical protein
MLTPDPRLVVGHIYEFYFEHSKITSIAILRRIFNDREYYSFEVLADSMRIKEDDIFSITFKNINKFLVRELQIEDLPLYITFHCSQAMEKILREYKPC